MDFKELLNDKTKKPKEKTEQLSFWLSENPSELDRLIDFAKSSKDPVKATCIEAIEFATKGNPTIASESCFEFVISTLTEKAPRVKWESAKVIGNIAHLFPGLLDIAIKNLLINSRYEGTVVRWSAAFALGEILKLKTEYNIELLPTIDTIIVHEEKNSIKKIYLDALKKVKI
jgi:hypothetical protein